MQGITITDLTFDFQRWSKELNRIIFNPSITWVHGDTFLICARAIRRSKELRARDAEGQEMPIDRANPDPRYNPQHPWLGGPNTPTWWQGQEDTSLLFVARMKSDGSIQVEQFWGELGPRSCKDEDDFCDVRGLKVSPIIDARLFRKGIVMKQDGTLDHVDFFVTGNDFIGRDNDFGRDRFPAMRWGLLTMYGNGRIRVRMSDYQFLCDNKVHGRSEKNWNFFNYISPSTGVEWNVISYKIAPQFEMLGFRNSDSSFTKPQRCEWLHVETMQFQDVFGEFTKNYTSGGKEIAAISLSTPSYPYPTVEGKQRYISVGHVKIDYKMLFARKTKDDPLYETIMNDFKESHVHPIFIYYGYMYTFTVTEESNSKLTVEIRTVSPLFMVDGYEKRALCFPSGLALTDGQVVAISYGEADIKAKVVTMSLAEFIAYCSISAKEMSHSKTWPTMVVGR